MRSSDQSGRSAPPPRAAEPLMPPLPTPVRRLEGQESVYELTSAEPVILGRLSVFYPAVDTRTSEVVLIKSFRDAPDESRAVNAFYKEVRAIRQLRHPNILPVLDYSPGEGPASPPFLILPWCRGGNLREVRGPADFVPLSNVIGILEQVANAIDYAHQQGVIHGDIKPENILLSADQRTAYLADFGMARFFDVTDRVRQSQEAPLAAGRAGAGTSAYLSPEQLADNEQTSQSDMYSFALIVYELLTGRLPFDVSAPLYRQIHARVVGDLVDPADANPSLGRGVQAALRSGLAPNPRERPTRASDLCRMLTGAVPVPRSRSTRPSRKLRLQGWFSRLGAAQRIAVITTVITVLGGIITALIQIIPSLFGQSSK